MVITEVRVKLADYQGTSDRLRAFCSITFDRVFVVHDVKVIEGMSGLTIAMPSRKLTDHCTCGGKNHFMARYCNYCGVRLGENRAFRQEDGRVKLYSDIAHPISNSCREVIEDSVLHAYESEVSRPKEMLP